MPIFSPRSHEQILRDLISKTVSRTELSDVSVGSSLFILLNSIALEIANTESRLSNLRRGYSIKNATGSDLDARCAELPPIGIRRKRNVNASGSCLKITRDVSTILSDLLIPAGSSVQRGTDGIIYKTASDEIISAGFTEIENVYIVCESGGIIGNAEQEAINTITNMPEGVTEVINTVALTNGIDIEDDVSLRNRATRYINSIGRVNKSTLEFLGTTFVSSSGQSFKFASVYEDPTKPGYCELVVDDGTGLINPGYDYPEIRTFVVPTNGTLFITHARPVANPLNAGNIFITRDGVDIIPQEGDFTSIPERGLLYFRQGFLQEGDIVEIKNLKLFKGLIAELQNEIEGNVNNALQLTGFRAAGTRVRVVTPQITDTFLKASIIVVPDEDATIINKRVQNAIIDYVNNLDIGQELIPSRLITHLIRTQRIISCNLKTFNGTTTLETIYPTSDKHVLRIKLENIQIENSN